MPYCMLMSRYAGIYLMGALRAQYILIYVYNVLNTLMYLYVCCRHSILINRLAYIQ